MIIVKVNRMPLHEVVLRQSYFGQECVNRFNYVSSGTPAAVTQSFGLASAMGWILGAGLIEFEAGSLARRIQLMQNAAVTYVDVLVKDVYNPLDFYTTAFNPGTIGTSLGTGTALSPISAFGFRSSRTRLDIKRGFKRFVGLRESDVDSGGLIEAAILTGSMNLVANSLGNTLTYDDEGNTLTYQPVIVSKFRYTTPGGNFAYEYYPDEQGGETEQLLNVADANNWQPYDTVRSQVSRQYGRGR